MTRRAALLAAVLAASCSGTTEKEGKEVKEIATNVLTLQSGDLTTLRARRGEGPFREYAVPPAEMVGVAEKALRTKVAAVFPNARAGEVVAKERTPDAAWDDRYAQPWRSAVVVIVHAVPEDPGRSRVEVHAMQRGPFHKGSIGWESDVPPLLDRFAAERAGAAAPAK